MFGNLGIHIIQYPTGRYGFVGTLTPTLGTVVPANLDDIMAGRAATNPHDGKAYTVKFPTFETHYEAQAHLDATLKQIS
jgi:hypothetical protein